MVTTKIKFEADADGAVVNHQPTSGNNAVTSVIKQSLDAKACEDLIAAIQSSDSFLDNNERNQTRGQVFFPLTDGFEKARMSVWNYDAAGMPLAIIKCANANHVSLAITFARKNAVKVCVHTAGAHSSHAVVNNCVVIDLSLMRDVHVNPEGRTATVAGGAMIGDVDKATKPHGLALPMGHVHHTGVAGMALNATSGVGYLCRTRNLTVTYLKGATLVMADGNVTHISEKHNSELLWAIRGAGSNFGVAIEMVFSLTRVAPKVYAGDLVKFGKGTGPGKLTCCCCINSKETREELVMKWFQFFDAKDTPIECSSLLVIAPHGPVISRLCYAPVEKDALKPANDIKKEAQEAFAPLADFGFTLMNTTKMMDYWDGVQKMGEFSPSYYYQKAANMSAIPEDNLLSMIDELCSYAESCPVTNMGSGIIVMPLGGKLETLEPGSIPTAEVYSQMKWWFIVITEFPRGPKDPEVRAKCVQWVRDVYKVVEPYASKDEGRQKDYWSDVLGDIYGSKENIAKLQYLKAKYDGDNFFSWNRNILPKKSDKE